MTQPTQEWLEARSKASAILDRFIVSLRRGGQLWGPIAVNGRTPYMECINELAEAIALSGPQARPEGARRHICSECGVLTDCRTEGA